MPALLAASTTPGISIAMQARRRSVMLGAVVIDIDQKLGRVLILDEVDALVIDEEPNEPSPGPKRSG